ncbi:unnamed protein product, partial [Tenebrio molitor]
KLIRVNCIGNPLPSVVYCDCKVRFPFGLFLLLVFTLLLLTFIVGPWNVYVRRDYSSLHPYYRPSEDTVWILFTQSDVEWHRLC